MRAKTLLLLAMPLACALAPSAGAEEYRGTWEQQMACTPDVFRLCSEQIPDSNRIVACLRQNTSDLSNGCRAVFESNASAPKQPVPARRADPPRATTDRW